MNSYFKFLNRNKAYAAIDVFGLAVSIMFVVLIGCYTWQETHIDTQHSKADRMYWLGLDMRGKKTMGSHWYLQYLLKDRFPEIESSTAIYRFNGMIPFEDRLIATNFYFVDSTFYDIFDFKLLRGNPKTALSDRSKVVVSQEYARKLWGEEDPMGKHISLDKGMEPLEVAGVMEPMKNTVLMSYDRHPVDVLMNFNMVDVINWSLTDKRMGNATGVEVLLLAKEGHDLTLKKKEYEAAVKNDYWIINLPEDNVHLEVYPFSGHYFSDIKSGQMNFGDIKLIRLLFGIGLVILLFAITNYINLTVALAGKRAKEMATRRLLGESRIQIIWRLISESTMLCGFSMILGIVLAFLMQPYASIVLKTPLDIKGCVNIFTVTFLFTILLIMSLTSGIIPALMLSSLKPIEAVKGAFRRKSNMIFGKIFIVIQNVATITMIACALTLYLQVRHLINAPLGYDYEGVMHLQYQYFEKDNGKFKNELMKLPFVEHVSYCCGTPHNRGNNNTFQWEGKTFSFREFIGDSAYMDVLGLKIMTDHKLASDWKIYINQRAVNELGIEETTTKFPFGDNSPSIAGVLKDYKLGNILSEQHPIYVSIYRPFEYFEPWSILIKVKGDEHESLRQIKDLYESLYGKEYSDFVFEAPFMRQEIEKDFEDQTRLSSILTIFAIIAIIISILGLTAMSTFYVRQRALDIAVHKVMGGSSTEVLIKLVRTFMLYVLIGAAISIPIIYFVMNDWLSQFSYRIEIYWWIYATSAILAIIICFMSVIIQCRKAANTNPLNSLK